MIGMIGMLKGVMLLYCNLLFIVVMLSVLCCVLLDDVVYMVLFVLYVYGFVLVCLGSLYVGVMLWFVLCFLLEVVCVVFVDEGVMIFQGVFVMYVKLFEYLYMYGYVWCVLWLCFVYLGGLLFDVNLKVCVECLYGVLLYNGYGMIESSLMIMQMLFDVLCMDSLVGVLILGVDVWIVVLDGIDVLLGEVGEICVCGLNVMFGYYCNVDVMCVVVLLDGWLSIGDFVWQDVDGVVMIVGCSKELIICLGFNVYLVEVEQVLNVYLDVVQVVVIGCVIDGNEEVFVFVECVLGVVVDEVVLYVWCVDWFIVYKCFVYICVFDVLLVVLIGKVFKYWLCEFV